MDDGGNDDAGGTGGPPESLALAAFDDPEPLTAAEVADATGMDPERVASALDRLTTAGRLGTKTVGDRRVWYATPGGGNGSDVHPAGSTGDAAIDATASDLGGGEDTDEGDWSADEVTVRGTGGPDADEHTGEFDETPVEAALADLDVPGTSEMMRDWRRSAVRAAFDHVRAVGTADSGAVIDEVYPGNRAGYGDRDSWWTCVAPRLASLPGIDREGDRWEFTGFAD